MNNVHLSIWGIRDGFEKTGMFHTHDIAELKKIQQDRFRDIGKMLKCGLLHDSSAGRLYHGKFR